MYGSMDVQIPGRTSTAFTVSFQNSSGARAAERWGNTVTLGTRSGIRSRSTVSADPSYTGIAERGSRASSDRAPRGKLDASSGERSRMISISVCWWRRRQISPSKRGALHQGERVVAAAGKSSFRWLRKRYSRTCGPRGYFSSGGRRSTQATRSAWASENQTCGRRMWRGSRSPARASHLEPGCSAGSPLRLLQPHPDFQSVRESTVGGSVNEDNDLHDH